MRATHLRRAATVLLESAIRIAPPDSRVWGQAMRGELTHVEGSWAAAMWSLGGAGVLARHALASLFIPGLRGQAVPPGPGLFAKGVSVGKAALAAGAVCVLASLLFFAAPPFRQGLHVAFAPWVALVRSPSSPRQPGLLALARRAEQKHDAEGLAFCAVRLQDSPTSARLAEEAVGIDPSLLWVYAVVAVRHPDLPEISQWIPKLEAWDPQNALFPLIAASSSDIRHVFRGDTETRGDPKDPAWQSAMSAAFQSANFEDYLDRVGELDRQVVTRYRFYDPEEVLVDGNQGLPTYAFEDSRSFATSLIQPGDDRAVRGDRKDAVEKYWAVAHFGQLIDAGGHTGYEHRTGTSLQAMAYRQLRTLYQKKGDTAEAALFGYLATKFDPVSRERERFGGLIFARDTYRRNAAVVMASGLFLLIFSGLLVVTTAIVLPGRRAQQPAARTARPVATMLAMASAVGLLLSSATLYLTYRPYWYIFQDAILDGDREQAQSLRAFLDSTQMVPGLRAYLSPHGQFYFWAGVTSLAVCGLALLLLRHFLGRPRADTSA